MLTFRNRRKRNPHFLVLNAIASFIAAIICIVAFSVGPNVPLRWSLMAICAFNMANGTLCAVRYSRMKRGSM